MVNSKKIPTLIPLSLQLCRHDDDIIAIRNNQSLSVIELRKCVSSIHQALEQSSIQCWALAMQDSFHFVAGLLALFYSGKQPVLLNPLQREMDQHYQGLLTDNTEVNDKNSPQHDVINIHHLEMNGFCDFSTLYFKSSILTLFTSGSTGLPKPITKTIYQLEKESEIITAHFGSFTNHLFASSVTHDHLYGLTFKIMLALANKAPFICERLHYQEQLKTYHHKMMYITTPSIIKTLDENIKNIYFDTVFSAGGPLSYQAANLSLRCFGVLPHEIYGSSETGVIATRVQRHEAEPWHLFPEMRLNTKDQLSFIQSPLLSQEEPLNDKISQVTPYLFHLNGRLDKIVKIGEKRVSLTYIENQLTKQPEIINAVVIPLEQKNRTILAAVILLSDLGKLKLKSGHFQLTQFFRHQLKDSLPLITIPKKWRFVDYLPINNQGKTTYMELKLLFSAQEQAMKKIRPNELNAKIESQYAEFELHVPLDLFWFKGHFPSNPILPGVVQLNWVMHYSKERLNIQYNIESIDVIKFQIPILPNDNLLLRITWEPTNKKLHFSYTIANKVASSGKLTLC